MPSPNYAVAGCQSESAKVAPTRGPGPTRPHRCIFLRRRISYGHQRQVQSGTTPMDCAERRYDAARRPRNAACWQNRLVQLLPGKIISTSPILMTPSQMIWSGLRNFPFVQPRAGVVPPGFQIRRPLVKSGRHLIAMCSAHADAAGHRCPIRPQVSVQTSGGRARAARCRREAGRR